MKPNIKKLQAGGYLNYQPLPMIPQAQPAQQADPTGTAPAGPALDPEILKKMLGEGITNDVMQYTEGIEAAYTQYASMSDAERSTYKGKQLRSMMSGNMGQLNALMRAKKQFDASIETSKANSALDELAVTDSGVVVKDVSGKMNVISFSAYAQDNNSQERKYTALTNAELITEREMNADLVGNSNIFSILNYGKGMEKVKEEVVKILSDVKASSESRSVGGYDMNSEDATALQQAAASGAFKIKEGQSIETNEPQLEKAKVIMWQTLSDSAKSVLKARAAQMVKDPNAVDETAMTLAVKLLEPSGYRKTSVTSDESYTKGGAGGKGGKTKYDKMGAIEMAFHGGSNEINLSTIGPAGGVRIDGFGNALPPSIYTDKDGHRTTLENNEKLKEISYLGQAFTMNGDAVNPVNTVITGEAYYTELPVVMNSQGKLQVDEAGAKKYAEYKQEFDNLPENEQTEMKKSELKSKYGITGLNIRKLLVADAASYTDSWFDDRNEKYYEEADGNTKDLVGNIVDPKSKTVRSWSDNDLHKHLVFIPVRDLSSARFADGNTVNANEQLFEFGTFNTGKNGKRIAAGSDIEASDSLLEKITSKDYWNN